MQALKTRNCRHDDDSRQPLDSGELDRALSGELSDWQHDQDKHEIRRDFRFKNYYHTMAFVNAVAWIANKEAHHPDLEVGYGHCLVRFTTHDIKGLGINDLICAAKVDALLDTGDFGPKVVSD